MRRRLTLPTRLIDDDADYGPPGPRRDLVDSNDEHAQAWVETLAEFGHTIAFGDAREAIGEGADKLLPDLLGIEDGSREGKRIKERRTVVFRERHLSTVRPFPGSQALLERMHAAGLHLVTATSASDEEMNAMLQILGASPLMYDTSTASDAKRSKPDPDIIEWALRKAGCLAHEAIMLGDTRPTMLSLPNARAWTSSRYDVVAGPMRTYAAPLPSTTTRATCSPTLIPRPSHGDSKVSARPWR